MTGGLQVRIQTREGSDSSHQKQERRGQLSGPGRRRSALSLPRGASAKDRQARGTDKAVRCAARPGVRIAAPRSPRPALRRSLALRGLFLPRGLRRCQGLGCVNRETDATAGRSQRAALTPAAAGSSDCRE